MRFIITGANRGIGLEFVKQLAERGDHVEAGARDPEKSEELLALVKKFNDRVRAHTCDVASDASVKKFASAVGDVAVDVLINNAGVMGKMQSLEDLDLDDATNTFNVNALGALRVTRAFLPQMERAETRRIMHITSGMGSIADNGSGGAYGYRMSKASLNMANKSLSVDLRKRNFICVVMNPGWVQTDMGGRGAPTPVEESVKKMIARVDGLTAADAGSFLDYKGGTYSY